MPFMSGLLLTICIAVIIIISGFTLAPGFEALAIGSAVGFAYAHGYRVRTKERQS